MRAVTAILFAPFAILTLEWSLREAPPACGDAEAWQSGLAPAAFVTGCICLTVVVRVSAARRGGKAGAPTIAAVALWLAMALVWWAGGTATPVYLWAFAAYLLLIAAVPAVATLAVVNLVRPSWSVVTAIAWVCAIVLVPGGVVLVDTGGTDFYC